ncbi:hypothetical protein MMM109_03580 [Helicobacter pylori]
MKKQSGYQKLKAELKDKDQLIKSLIGEGHRDEEEEYSKSCLGLE